MVYLWIETLFEQTFQRVQDGGNIELGVMPSLGSQAFLQWMQVMRYEVPAILYGSVLQNITVSAGKEAPDNCTEFYTAIGFSQAQSEAICQDSLFDFSQPMSTYFNLVNIYFYEDVFNATI